MSSSNPVKILPEASMRVCLPRSIVTFARRVPFFMLEILVPNVLRNQSPIKRRPIRLLGGPGGFDPCTRLHRSHILEHKLFRGVCSDKVSQSVADSLGHLRWHAASSWNLALICRLGSPLAEYQVGQIPFSVPLPGYGSYAA